MKHLLVCILVTFFLTVSLPRIASAHILQSDGDIGAVMHVDPEDDPIANEPSVFYFEFKDKSKAFTPDTCLCTFTILENKKTIYTQSLFQNNSNPSLQSASVTYTFSQKDVYDIIIDGKPLHANTFKPFQLMYAIRVARESATPTPTNSLFLWSSQHIFLLASLGTLVLFFVFRYLGSKPTRSLL